MKTNHFIVDFDIHLIQQLRLIHALAEAGLPISVPNEQQYKFSLLKEKFSFSLVSDCKNDSKSLSEIISIDHKKPFTCIENICKPLIFPHEICSHCRTLWKDSRKRKFSFIGLLTKEREKNFRKWTIEQNGGKGLNSILSTFYKLKEKFKMKMGLMSQRRFGELQVFSSRRGRDYPTKAWDESFYRILANSEFVLCPRGKSDWTYRFFEAILCGAIPVVEKDCNVYRDFKFHYMNEPQENLIWSREIAEYNYQLCLKRITIPLPDLNKTLKTLLE